ncbi:phytanoyl-CoA dioxygenase family protein [Tellurirhabdus bombi]|uniref:phytanoyl-CoA dioxygenase family protein n=1 Tax=Tellurirhabdus bombi TaxID=2907205 RepID=UPI001F1E9918|nr:phytanoyl-CoA dioxygenase family protein [Tellurirhabdus bombi]
MPPLNTPWVESPFFLQELEESAYSPETKVLLQQYAEDGYVVIDPEIDEKVLTEVRDSLKPTFQDHGTNRLQDAWKYNEAVKKIASAPKVMQVLTMLYRRQPVPFQTLNFSTGSQQRTHSDSIHFNSIPERFLAGVWVALEDIHDGNGPLHYYPKSHKLPFYDLSILGLKGSASTSMEEMLASYYARYEDFIAELVAKKKLEKRVLNLKKGQAMIWSANLLHGGEPITQAGSTRYTQVNHYYFSDCAYYRPMLTDMALERISIQKVTNIATGQEVKSKYLNTSINHIGYAYKLYLPGNIMRTLVPSGVRRWVKQITNR